MENKNINSGIDDILSTESGGNLGSEAPMVSAGGNGIPTGENMMSVGGNGVPTWGDGVQVGGNEVHGVNQEQKKPNKTKRVAVLTALVAAMALGCGGVYYYAMQNQTKPETEKKESIATKEPEVKEFSDYRMEGNDLSDFDLSFMKMGEEDENKIYSPLSIKYALAMLKDAAEGETREQIEDVIGDYKPKSYINSENLALANAMFIRTDFQDKVQENYTSGIQKNYNAEVILDDFATPKIANDWVKDKTLGIIDEMFNESQVNPETRYMLVNALAIDMEWNYQMQCAPRKQGLKSDYCHNYNGAPYKHEDYLNAISDLIGYEFEKTQFGGKEVEAAHIGANVNNYNIIEEVGEEAIREKVLAAYEEWKASEDGRLAISEGLDDFDIEKYMEELKANYGTSNMSTDFKIAVNDSEKVFIKELKEYGGSTLEYIGIMPTKESLGNYVEDLDAEKAKEVIGTAKEISKENFKEGVVTKISGYIPFFKFNQQMDLTGYLPELGIKDVFSKKDADLSAMIAGATDGEGDREHIDLAIHKADIDFSNDGIKAAAVTAMGGLGAGGPQFIYSWEVPVEEVDMTFDKPFLFLIRDKATGEVWFAGEVNEI